MDLGWVVLGIVGWTAGLAFVLVLMRMAGDQDRAALDAEARLFPPLGATIVRLAAEAGAASELEIEAHGWQRESDLPGSVVAAIIPLNAPGGSRARSGEDGPIAPAALLHSPGGSGDSSPIESDDTAPIESDDTSPAHGDIEFWEVGCPASKGG